MSQHISVLGAVGVALCVSALSAGQAPAVSTRPVAGPSGDVQRGQYIVEHVAMCVECHSTRDAQGNIVPSMRFMGGPVPPGPGWAGDWADRAPRIAGLPGYTDEAARRLLTAGAIGRQGARLRTPMPRFRMNAQDAADVIAFLRSVP